MYLTIFDEVDQMGSELGAIDAASLYREFEKVKDGRGKKGKRYPLPLLLTLLLLGKLAGETKINGIVDWIKERKEWLKRQLNWPKRFPVNSTYSEALMQCDGQEVAKAIAAVILKARARQQAGTASGRGEQSGQEKLVHTAMDGKVMRGTLGHASEEQPAVHVVSLYECESGVVIAQEAVKSKENELAAATALLHPVLVKGRIISADAMHTQKAWCAAVAAYGGYYLLVAKKNQPTVRQDILDFFADKTLDQGEWRYHKTVQKGHGRREVREIWTSTQMNEWFEQDWAAIAQIFLIRRFVPQGEKEREEVVAGFTNLPRKKATAKRLLDLEQKHWHIENRLHYRRDVTLGEDACQVRVKGAPLALAALNGGVLALMDWLQVRNVASQMRHFCAHPHKALHLLLSRLER
jgi:predicted transposase YbfD/YdcC